MSLRLLLALLLSLPPWWQDRAEPGRAARLELVAQAMIYATDRATCTAEPSDCSPLWPPSQRDELLLLLVAMAWHESRFARHVHAGRCGPHECGARRVSGRIVHSARTVWQLERTALIAEEWPELEGLEEQPTMLAAWAASKVLSRSRAHCGTTAGTIAMYATGKRCRWRGAAERVRTVNRLRYQAAWIARGSP